MHASYSLSGGWGSSGACIILLEVQEDLGSPHDEGGGRGVRSEDGRKGEGEE